MVLFISFLIAVSSAFSTPAQSLSPDTTGEELEIVDFKGLQQYLTRFDDKTVVINFWATWCVPCVRELPYFEEATSYYKNDDVEIVLVSLDFSKQIDTRLKPFLEKHQLQSHVVLLDDPDANSWINKVSPEWSGAIPATLIRHKEKEAFYEQSFHSFDELKEIIQPFLKS